MVFFMKIRVNVLKFIPLIFLHLASFGYIIIARYNIGSGYRQIG